jgi:hypothetical protein
MKNLIVWGIVLFGGAYLGAKFYMHYRVSNDLDNLLIMVSPFANVTYSGVSSTMGGTLSIDDLEVKVNGYRDPVRADKLSLVTPGFWYLLDMSEVWDNLQANEVPESLGFEILGFRSATDSDLLKMLHKRGQEAAARDIEIDDAAECTGKYGYTPTTLVDLGYSELVADLQMGYRKEGNNMVVDVQTSIEDMYDMDFEFTLDGAFSPQSVMTGNYRPKLIDARLEYVDQSLDERTSKLCARAGLSEEEVLAAKIDAFNAFGEETGVVFDEQILEPYKEFLGGKSTFVMTARPNEPLNVSQIDLYKASDIPALLNLTAVAR